eukprot:5808405-Heterocapsa_arctica.AAC.1
MTWISLGLPSFLGAAQGLFIVQLAMTCVCCTVRRSRYLGHVFPPAPAPARGVPGAGPTPSG